MNTTMTYTLGVLKLNILVFISIRLRLSGTVGFFIDRTVYCELHKKASVRPGIHLEYPYDLGSPTELYQSTLLLSCKMSCDL